jgi:chloramphenicol-sensitive protein RarD
MNRGILYGIGAYTIWGFLPLYWKALQKVPAGEILANRIVWSFAFVLLLLAARRRWGWIRSTLGQPRTLLTFVATSLLLGINWFVYIWAVNAGFVIETSLGYFINPLVNVLLGFVFLHERLRKGQLVALALAVSGVGYLTLSYGAFPWIALTLAFTFGLYGLLRKTGSLGPAEGLGLEMAILLVPALATMLLLDRAGSSSFGRGDWQTSVLLLGVGIITAVPLLLFAAAAKRITLTNLGLLQYIAPSIQFLLGVFVFQEPFGPELLVGFVLIWAALAVYSYESVWSGHARRRERAVSEQK